MPGIRDKYSKIGVKGFYETQSDSYENPHERIIQNLVRQADKKGLIGKNVLDLCCGSGEVTLVLAKHNVTGTDPYTGAIYKTRTGKTAIPLTFVDIAQGKLKELQKDLPKRYDTIICSFSLHLCPESLLHQLLWELSQVSDTLIIITPHKRPDCNNISGWKISEETILEKVRMRIYKR